MGLLDLILESAGEGVYGLDADGLTTFVNPAAERMLGHPPGSLIGEPMHALLHHKHPDGSPYPKEQCPIYAAFRDGEVHRVEDEVFWRHDGTPFPVEYTSTPIREGDKLVGAVVVFWDVTARKLSEDRLRAALDEVQSLKNKLQEENTYLQDEIREQRDFGEIIGDTPAMQALLHEVSTVGPTDASVLIGGETGTGKELIARAIHEASPRKKQPLIKVNCASVPRELFESEFFGHVKGAFTGAQRDRAGRFGLADGGTLFLDEVGEIPLEMQSKLLRVLQEGTYERIGSEKTSHVDVRIVAATNLDLSKEVEVGRFRRDLYYRLNVFPLVIPPLRDRKGDIGALAQHFLNCAQRRMKLAGNALTAEEIAGLESYAWPGNVRELQNVMERAAIYAGTGKPRLGFFQGDLVDPGTQTTPVAATTDDAALSADPDDVVISDEEMKRREIRNIKLALDRANWRVYGDNGAAAALGMKPTTLASRIKKLGLSRSD